MNAANDSGMRSSSRAPRVLTVLPDFPCPTTSGLQLRHLSNLQLIHGLGCYSALLYFTTEERETGPVESTPLARICDEVHHGGQRFPHANFSVLTLAMRKLGFLLRGATGLPGRCYPFSMSYDQVGAEAIVVAEAQKLRADFVILASIFMHYTAALRRHGFRVIVDAADVLTNLSASFMSLEGRGGRLGLYANYLACRSQERIFLKQAAEVWATSASEAEEFRRIAGEVRVLVVPNSLDEQAVRPARAVQNAVVGFIGTYSYRPNLDAAEFLAEQVFPPVRKDCPQARLQLAGANMPDAAASRLRTLEGVAVLGRVEDSGRFMDECAVLAMPVLLRGGVPLKLIEAMARGKAVVASPELVAGVEVADGQELLIRRNPQEYADAIVALLQDADLRQKLGANARAAFLRQFSLAGVEQRLRRDSVLMEQRSGAPRPTAAVFP